MFLFRNLGYPPDATPSLTVQPRVFPLFTTNQQPSSSPRFKSEQKLARPSTENQSLGSLHTRSPRLQSFPFGILTSPSSSTTTRPTTEFTPKAAGPLPTPPPFLSTSPKTYTQLPPKTAPNFSIFPAPSPTTLPPPSSPTERLSYPPLRLPTSPEPTSLLFPRPLPPIALLPLAHQPFRPLATNPSRRFPFGPLPPTSPLPRQPPSSPQSRTRSCYLSRRRPRCPDR